MRSRVSRGQAQKGGTEIDLTELKSNGTDTGVGMDISVFYFTPLSKVSIDLSSSLQARTSLKDQTHHLNHSLGQIPRAKSQSFSPLVLVTFRADNSLWLGVRRWTATLCIVDV